MSGKDKQPLLPKLRFAEFRGEWITVELGRFSQLVTERVGVTACVPYTIAAGIGLISQEEKLGRIIAGSSLKNYIVLQRNDFAYNKSATKAYPEGFIALYAGDERAAVPNSIFTCFRVNQSQVNPSFLSELFQNNLHGKWLKTRVAVGARAHGSLQVSNDDLMAIPVPLPSDSSSLVEQQKIAACLSSLNTLITAEAQKLDTLKTHKKGLMQQLFPRAGETTPRLRFAEFRGAGEWEIKTLKTACEVNPSNSLLPDTFAYIDLESVEAGELKARKIINKAEAPSRAQRLLRYGDVLFQMVRPYQRNNLHFKIDEEIAYVASTGYAQLRANESNYFLFHSLHTDDFVERVIAKCTGSNYPAINSSDLADIHLAIPSEAEQQKIAACLSSLDELITAQAQKVAALQSHKKGLMQQLFPAQSEASA